MKLHAVVCLHNNTKINTLNRLKAYPVIFERNFFAAKNI